MRKHYRSLGAKGVLPLLSVARTRHSLTQRAKRLGVTRKPHWSKSADAHLVYLWEARIGVNAIAMKMGRTPQAVYRRGQDLGLPLGCPNGFEFVTQAARRCGFTVETMWRIIKAGKVRTQASLSDPRIANKGNWRRRYVDPDEIDEAVKKWLDSELVDQAAERRGLVSVTLRGWLVKAGVLPAVRRKKHLRIPSEVIDRVVAEHSRAA